ncbi:PAS domain-containing protein [Psychrobacillus sp. FJAT-51614]|uniref:PAS domain-containing protein n=1 Tax=Psychrobacillus mangrovi TaxID=3117745 RepID=A0ABU8F6P0_9BACI
MNTNIPSQLQPFIQMVDFIGMAMGNNCEVVLHDVSKIEHSIVAIKNNHISNRKVGGSLTDLALKILKDKSYEEKDFLINYSGKTQDGKILRSSTFFIKDEYGNVIGMLCLNMDVSKIVETRNLLDSLISGISTKNQNSTYLDENLPTNEDGPMEDLSTSIEELTSSIILRTIAETNIPPYRMSANEKMDVVKQLNEKGVFLIKGAVSEVALHLKTSEATVYRYLNKI